MSSETRRMEKAREELDSALKIMHANWSYTDEQTFIDVCRRIRVARDALDGEEKAPQEEWNALIDDIDRHRLEGYPICAPNHIIAVCIDIPTARRVARLPKLERKAREVLKHQNFWQRSDREAAHTKLDDAICALRAALNDSTGD